VRINLKSGSEEIVTRLDVLVMKHVTEKNVARWNRNVARWCAGCEK